MPSVRLRFLRQIVLGLTLLAGAFLRAEIVVDALSPAPTTRGGEVADFALSADDSRLLYLASSPRYEHHELFSLDLHNPLAKPVRINRLLAPYSRVHRFAFAAGDSRVVYQADEAVPGRIELFSHQFATGTRTRLNAPLPPLPVPAEPGPGRIFPDPGWPPIFPEPPPLEVVTFLVSPGGGWVIYEGPPTSAGGSARCLVPADGSRPARSVPFEPLLLSGDKGFAFTPDDQGLLVTDQAEGVARLGRLNLETWQVAWLDEKPAGETWQWRRGRLASAGDAVYVDAMPADGYSRHRIRRVSLNGDGNHRWIGETLENFQGVALWEQGARIVVAGAPVGGDAGVIRIHDSASGDLLQEWPLPETALIGAVNFGASINLFYGGAGAPDSPELNLADAAGGVVAFVGRDGTGRDGVATVNLISGATSWFTTNPQNIFTSEHLLRAKDETGTRHLFLNDDAGFWRISDDVNGRTLLDPSPARAVLHVVAATRKIVFESGFFVSDLFPAKLNLADWEGGASIELGFRAQDFRLSPPTQLANGAGDLFYIRASDNRIVRHDLSAPEQAPTEVSPEWSLRANPSLVAISPSRDWVLIASRGKTGETTPVLVSLHGQAARTLQTGRYLPQGFQWSGDGRFVLLQDDWERIWRAYDVTRPEAEPVEFPSLFRSLLGTNSAHEAVLVESATSTPALVFVRLDTGEQSVVPLTASAAGVLSGARLLNSLEESRWVFGAGSGLHTFEPASGEFRTLLQRPAFGWLDVRAADASHAYVIIDGDVLWSVDLETGLTTRLTESRPPDVVDIHGIRAHVDIARRTVTYTSTYPDGVPRLRRRSLDEPAEAGYPGESFATDAYELVVAHGAAAWAHDGRPWFWSAAAGATPRPVGERVPWWAMRFLTFADNENTLFVENSGRDGDSIYRIDTTTGDARRMTPPGAAYVASAFDDQKPDFAVGRDSQEVVFVADMEDIAVDRLYRARWTPDTPATDGLENPDYAEWVVTENLPVGTEAATEDADGDGIPNLLEYIHGNTPLTPDTSPGFALGLEQPAASWTELIYQLADSPRAAWVRPQVSADLANWFDLMATPARHTHDLLSGETRWLFLTPPGDRVFYRLRFTLPEPVAGGAVGAGGGGE